MNRFGLIFKTIGTVILAFIALGVLATTFILNSRTREESENKLNQSSTEITQEEITNETEGQVVEPVEEFENESEINDNLKPIKAVANTNSESAKESKKPYTSGLFPKLKFDYPDTWKIIETNEPSEDYAGMKEYVLEVTNDKSTLKFRFLPAVIARCGGSNVGLENGVEITDTLTEFPNIINDKVVTYGLIPVCPTGFLTNSTLPIDSNPEYAKAINEAQFLEAELKTNVFYDAIIEANFDTEEDKERIRDIIRSAKF